ncbi:hypothetical protein AK830_g4723 [Neonectria ditissima]|uniref:RING-type domain-containing protein n=1 Tax=Neonectria ditissima TaxID=78410 RepID=A0A0P7BNB1_9HYPO|nr:hypothetical protein AK830_g4723 [Neonectria ditissima]
MPRPGSHECSTCHRRFRTLQSLTQHLDANPHPVHACSQCSRTFASERALQQHVSDAPAHGVHRCAGCGRVFNTAQSLAQHLSNSSIHRPAEDGTEGVDFGYWFDDYGDEDEDEDEDYEDDDDDEDYDSDDIDGGLGEDPEAQYNRMMRLTHNNDDEPALSFHQAIETLGNPYITQLLLGHEPSGFASGWNDDDMDSSSNASTELLADLSYDNAEARRLVPRSIIGTPPTLLSTNVPTDTNDPPRGSGTSDNQTPGLNLDSDPLALPGPAQTHPQTALLDTCGSVDAESHPAEPLTIEAQLEAERAKNKALEQQLREAREALKLEKLIRQCGMCYEKTSNSVTKCGHIFCSDCIRSWQQQHQPPYMAPCPMCRCPMGKPRRVFRE